MVKISLKGGEVKEYPERKRCSIAFLLFNFSALLKVYRSIKKGGSLPLAIF